jgi:mRNA-degrading endonuclease YafQ of YafQ-DinJ toxin-antitoxin module
MPQILRDKLFSYYLSLLNISEQRQALKAIEFLGNNPRHPSLQTHKKGNGYLETYVNKDIRIVFECTSDTIILIAVGHHDILRKF